MNIEDGESKEGSGLFAKLPPRQTAWIVLLHDLAWKWKAESITGNLVERLREELKEWAQAEPEAGSQSKTDDKTEVKKLRYHHLVSLMELLKIAQDGKSEKKLDPPNDLQGWAVWRNGKTYEHFPIPEFETFRDLDRFLFVWSSGLEWLDELRKQDKLEEGQAKEAEANTVQEQVEATEAAEQVRGIKWRSKYINLWGLAGWVVINEKYDNFARRSINWFKDQLATFKTDPEINEQSEKSKAWLSQIEAFLSNVKGNKR